MMDDDLWDDVFKPEIARFVDSRFRTPEDTNGSFYDRNDFTLEQEQSAVVLPDGTSLSVSEAMTGIVRNLQNNKDLRLSLGVDTVDGQPIKIRAIGTGPHVQFQILDEDNMPIGRGTARSSRFTKGEVLDILGNASPQRLTESKDEFMDRVGRGDITQEEYDNLGFMKGGSYRDPSGGTMEPDEYAQWLKENN